MALTAKQQLFCDEYLIDRNATQAAIRAGYSAQSAHSIGDENLRKPAIAEYLEERNKARQARTEITQDYVLDTIKDTVERCRQCKPVLDRSGEPVLVETPTGELVPAFSFEPAQVLKGCELLGKHLGTFTEVSKVQHSFTGPDGLPLTVNVSTVYVSVGDKRNG